MSFGSSQFMAGLSLSVARPCRELSGVAQSVIDVPARIGPCEFGKLDNQIAVRCPVELAHIRTRSSEGRKMRTRDHENHASCRSRRP